MIHTEYSWMTTAELLAFFDGRESSTPLETELACRLHVAVDMLEETSAGAQGMRPSDMQGGAHS